MQETLFKNKVDLQEAASLLGVSSATVKNWIGHKYLIPDELNKQKLVFDYHQVKALKDKIASGEVDRLNKRANKKNSAATFIPDEYAQDKNIVDLIEKIIIDQRGSTSTKEAVFLIALSLLKDKGLIQFKHPLDLSTYTFTHQSVKQELQWWFENTKRLSYEDKRMSWLDLKIPKLNDFLGLLYQSLSAEGDKSQAGSYYTPKAIVDTIVYEHVKKNFVILDPCCGTGQFLLSAADKIENPLDIWGFDIDEVAVRIARLNLLLRFPDKDFNPNIFHKNTLLEVGICNLFNKDELPLFDAVITNPPWGVHFSDTESQQLRALYPSIKSNEAFSYFLERSLKFLKKEGVLSFILPEAILNVKVHSDIRKVILENSSISKIIFLDRVFKNVFTPVIQLDLKNEISKTTHTFEAKKNDVLFRVEQSRLKNNQDFLFDVFTNDKDNAIFKKMLNLKHTTLKDQADWALGIVTGNNDKHLADQPMDGYEPILTGKDIKRFISTKPSKYIKFDPSSFQQVAPESRYRAKEKLIYKFISRDLVFSYDNGQILTLNSANILIPRIPSYPIKTLLAILNSSLYQFIYQKKFGSIKILKGDLEKLPLPFLEKESHLELERLVDSLTDGSLSNEARKAKYIELDGFVMDLFLLEKEERDHIRSNVRSSDKSLIL